MRQLILAMLFIAVPCISNAQTSRAGSWEGSISAIWQDSLEFDGENGSFLDVDAELGFGLNFALNINPKLSVGLDLEYLKPRYSMLLVDDTGVNDDLVINHKFTQWNTRFKGTWNMVDGPFTPYLEAGIGWTYIDSNVADGPPQTGCYWHPYWGYICSNYYSTFDDTVFSYGVGGGLRYEFRGGAFLKASYNYWELDGLGQSEDSGLISGRLELGILF
jgi:opacity protein-like surface antigen